MLEFEWNEQKRIENIKKHKKTFKNISKNKLI